MAGGSNGYRGALVRRQLTPGLVSSSPATGGLPQFIFFSTSYLERDSAVPHKEVANTCLCNMPREAAENGVDVPEIETQRDKLVPHRRP